MERILHPVWQLLLINRERNIGWLHRERLTAVNELPPEMLEYFHLILLPEVAFLLGELIALMLLRSCYRLLNNKHQLVELDRLKEVFKALQLNRLLRIVEISIIC